MAAIFRDRGWRLWMRFGDGVRVRGRAVVKAVHVMVDGSLLALTGCLD